MNKNKIVKDSAIVGIREETETQRILKRRYPDKDVKKVKIAEAIKLILNSA